MGASPSKAKKGDFPMVSSEKAGIGNYFGTQSLPIFELDECLVEAQIATDNRMLWMSISSEV